MQQILRKSLLSVIEQALFSGTTFMINILLIRWFSKSDYGAFAIGFAIYILLAGVYTALIFEPIAVFAPVKYAAVFSAYIRQQLKQHLLLAIILFLTLLIVSPLLLLAEIPHEVIQALLGVAVGHGGLLLLWFFRRVCYARQQITLITVITAGYAGCQLVSLGSLHAVKLLNPFTAFAVPGVITLVLGVAGAALRFSSTNATFLPENTNLVQENWRYGKWIILAQVLLWLSTHAYSILVGSLLSLEDAGALRAVQNITLPVSQLILAVEMLFFSWASRQYAEAGIKRLQSLILQFTAGAVLLAVSAYLLLLLFGDELLHLLYDGKYDDNSELLVSLGLLPIGLALSAAWGIGLKIAFNTFYVLFIDVVGAVTIFTVSIYLTTHYGLSGAAAGLALSSSARVVMSLALWWLAGHRSRLHDRAGSSVKFP